MPEEAKVGGGFGGGGVGIGEPGGGGDSIDGVNTGEAPNVGTLHTEGSEPDQGCRERAKTAEDKVALLESQLATAREALDAAERRHAIDMALVDADAIDLESARLLTEMAVAQMDEKDVALAVSDLRRRKPFLFRERSQMTLGAAMGAAVGPASPADAARDEAKSGDRRALLKYLRARRSA